jgi:hypothetical protein
VNVVAEAEAVLAAKAARRAQVMAQLEELLRGATLEQLRRWNRELKERRGDE